jgi:hypothetical protein
LREAQAYVLRVQLFQCAACGQTMFFESVRCVRCGAVQAFLPGSEGEPPRMVCFDASLHRLCDNSVQHGVCNWALSVNDPEPLCRACRLNDVIPDLTQPGRLDAWHKLEIAKRHLIYTLDALRLPYDGLRFSFLAPAADAPVFTGHKEGHIVINLAEAEDPFREKLRLAFGEGYRTVLGHFRHEIGHYYWFRLVEGNAALHARFRELFGDESVDYAASQQRHYTQGAPPDWPGSFVSAYATMHPWEDWAETWAHYLHMVDTLDTARSYGLALRPPPSAASDATQTLRMPAADTDSFQALTRAWLPVTLALNSLNRSMGLIDPYPFVLSDAILKKLALVHEVVAAT